MEKRFDLGQFGEHLWTREKAREIREELVALLEELAIGDTLVIDTEGVEVFDYSFANELFGRSILGLQHEYPGRFIVVENLTEYTRENLVKALEGIDLALIERTDGHLRLLGDVHPAYGETFSAIRRLDGPVTSRQLSQNLEISVNAMNERLSKLMELGLVRREKGSSAAGRKQYEYRALS